MKEGAVLALVVLVGSIAIVLALAWVFSRAH
jgi:hypothetical protein